MHAKTPVVERVLPLCAPKIAAAARESGVQTVLERTRLVHTVKAAISWSEWIAEKNFKNVDTSHGLKFDRSSMSLQAACDGAGVVLETATLALNELRSGALVPLAPELGSLTVPTYWLTCPRRHLNRRVVIVFGAWIDKKANAHEMEKSRLLESLGAGATKAHSH